jgi:transcription antitermination factor NusG
MINQECVKKGQALRVIDGNYAGLVGEVIEISEKGVTLNCQGNFENEPIDGPFFFDFDQLGWNDGKA